MASFLQQLDDSFANTSIARYFKLSERKSSLSVEFRGALATFMSMAYILAVNPSILADSGGPCVPDADGPFGPGFFGCVEATKKELITSTALSSMVGCFLMGLVANLPIALAPGMGMNAYFAYSVVGFHGLGDISYQAAMTAVLIEGIIFLVLAITGVRYAIVKLIPEPIRHATPAAIGAFLAHLGLQTAEGLGIVVSDTATAVTLGGCPRGKQDDIVVCAADGSCLGAGAYTCDEAGGVMTSGTTWLGILGTMIMLIMLAYRKRSAFVVGIGFVTFISWFRNTAVTYFPYDADGDTRFEYFKQVVSVEKLDTVLAPFTGDMKGVGVALITVSCPILCCSFASQPSLQFLYVDFLDTSGTLMALVSGMGLLEEDGSFPRAREAFACDALATIVGSFFGTSPVTSYIESGAGVEAGSKTGLTAVFCGFFFLISIFFAPLIASIPPWAIGGALIIVGALMARSLAKVKWYDVTHAATAFITVMIMPLTYSIAYGLIAGIGVWIVLQGTFFLLSLVGIEKPTFEPEEEGKVLSSESSEDGQENVLAEEDKDGAAKADSEP